MAISSRFLDDLRERIGLADIVGRRTRLTKKGREHSGLCPFHKEKTPSFTVNEDKGFYHCFGCGAHGSAFDFVMETEGLSFREAVEKLAGEVGMQVPQDSPQERERAERKKTLYDVADLACQYFQAMLQGPQGQQGLDYLVARGLTEQTLQKFRLGYAPDKRDGIKQALGAHGIKEAELIAAGLIIKRDDGSTYDRFRGRVMFPILDRRGRVVAFGGRILDADAKAAKYLNSPETDLFHKGRLLYAMDTAQVAARAGQPLVVTEGYMDVIALSQAGFEGAVAPLGTALTEDQIMELWKITPEPVLCFDGDNAGQRAASRAAERALPLIKAGVGLKFATLPDGEDPDSLVQAKGKTAFEEILDQAKPLSQVLWDLELQAGGTASPEDRAALQKRLDDHVRRIEDVTVRSHFQSSFKDRVWQLGRENRQNSKGSDGWKGGFKRLFKPQKPPVFEGDAKQRAVKSAQVQLTRTREQVLLATILNHPDVFEDVGEKLGNLAFTTLTLDNLRQEALKTLSGEQGLDRDTFQRHLRESGFSSELDSLLSPRVYEHAYFARPDEETLSALEGWIETYELYCRRDLQAELEDAQRQLAANMTPENFERFRALKMQEQSAAELIAK
ncbi:DNA primase [Magnetovibrio sp. PR-2]|uniref:DNA primase n=1 Tax=Magnetovibrio sp. PR-2 TaxID=3120356 RepID=UPI002FCDFC65